MCLYGKIIFNKKYTKTKKNGGNIPPIKDKRVLAVPKKCGRCMECMKARARDWTVRLQEDIKHNEGGKMITLTFSTEALQELAFDVKNKNHLLKGYELDNEIAKRAMRLFNERWRKQYKKAIRHWVVSELGSKRYEHIHLHGIVWLKQGQTMDDVERHWKYGFIWKGHRKGTGDKGKPIYENYVSARTINYMVKYIQKIDLTHKYYKPVILTSPGVGKDYLKTGNAKDNKFKENKTNETFKTSSGHKIALPIYYRNKIYTDEEKENLWIQKLDKEERYINGQRIDISKGEQEYFKALEYYQKINSEAGYGSDKIDWKRKEYEEARRQLIHDQRKISETRLIARDINGEIIPMEEAPF